MKSDYQNLLNQELFERAIMLCFQFVIDFFKENHSEHVTSVSTYFMHLFRGIHDSLVYATAYAVPASVAVPAIPG